MHIDSIIDREFYGKVVPIAQNAHRIAKKDPPLDRDIYHLHTNAVRCFFQKQYSATIFLASIGVERYLNKILKRKKWLNLNSESIKKAYDTGIIAVTELLDKSEKDVLKKGEPNPIFCSRRNKIFHGDTEGLVKIKGPEITPIDARAIDVGTRIEKKANAYVIDYLESAYDQLLKFQKFLLKLQS